MTNLVPQRHIKTHSMDGEPLLLFFFFFILLFFFFSGTAQSMLYTLVSAWGVRVAESVDW